MFNQLSGMGDYYADKGRPLVFSKRDYPMFIDGKPAIDPSKHTDPRFFSSNTLGVDYANGPGYGLMFPRGANYDMEFLAGQAARAGYPRENIDELLATSVGKQWLARTMNEQRRSEQIAPPTPAQFTQDITHMGLPANDPALQRALEFAQQAGIASVTDVKSPAANVKPHAAKGKVKSVKP